METNTENTVSEEQNPDQPAFSEQVLACIKSSLHEVESKIDFMEEELIKLKYLKSELTQIVERRKYDKD